MKTFRGKLTQVLSIPEYEKEVKEKETLGGYRWWEHVDQPTGGALGESGKRWAGMTGQLPAYLLDARAYLKEQLILAVQTHRNLLGLAELKLPEPWQGHNKPTGYGKGTGQTAKMELSTGV